MKKTKKKKPSKKKKLGCEVTLKKLSVIEYLAYCLPYFDGENVHVIRQTILNISESLKEK